MAGAPVQIPMCNGAVLHLPRGFKFSPSDEDLVVQYLRRRAVGEPLPCAVVVDADVRQHSPWALVPAGAKEKYFFARVQLQYSGGRRADLAAGEGYWKATGTEAPVYAHPDLALVGMKSELVFYRGAPPAGERTRWVMDEYRLAGAGLMSYNVMLMAPASSNSSAPPCRCAAAGAMDKKNEALPAALGAPIAPVIVNPDASWIICRIYKKKKRVPRVTVQANGGMSPMASCITDTSAEEEKEKEEEEVGNIGGNN